MSKPASLAWVLLLALAFSPAASAQTTWPDGCTVKLPLWVQQGLDGIFLGACNAHDLCYAQCNPEFGPFLGLGHKAACDATLLASMEAACAFWATQVALPLGDIQTTEDFVRVCNGVVAPGIYGIVNLPVGISAYWKDQCDKGCNPLGCDASGHTYPSTCGTGFGPSYCYISTPPPDPFPPPFFDPCWGVSCGMCSCDPYCCGGCNLFQFWEPFEPLPDCGLFSF